MAQVSVLHKKSNTFLQTGLFTGGIHFCFDISLIFPIGLEPGCIFLYGLIIAMQLGSGTTLVDKMYGMFY